MLPTIKQTCESEGGKQSVVAIILFLAIYNEFKSGGGIKSRTSLRTLATPPPKKNKLPLKKQIAEQKVGDIFFFGGVIRGYLILMRCLSGPMLEPGHPVATFGSGTARRGPRCETTGARGSGGSRASCAAWPGGGCTKRHGKMDESEGN